MQKIVGLFILAILFAFIGKIYSAKEKFVSPLTDTPIQFFASKIIRGKTLVEVMDEYEKAEDTKYGIVIKNLKTREVYTFNPHAYFEPASLYKLWVMAAVFDQIQTGKLDLDDRLSASVPALNRAFNISSESAELTEGTISNTVQNALQEMITKSDNYSALLLSYKVKISTMQTYLQNHGLIESKLGIPPRTTASDMALFFEKLYMGELANSTYTKAMIDLLRQQTINRKLPKNLPGDILIAHKTGELEDYTHDAGIVFGSNGDYIIVILTESDNPANAEEQIADISKIVYDYFEQNN